MKIGFKKISINNRKWLTVSIIAVTFVSVLALVFASQVPSDKAQSQSLQSSRQEDIEPAAERKPGKETAGVENQKSSQTSVQRVRGTTTKKDSTENRVDSQPKTKTVSAPSAQTVSLQVDTGSGSVSYSILWSKNMSVYNLMEKAKGQDGFSFEGVWYGSIGSYYITKINGVGCCWTYKINGESALGVSLETVEPGDTISWKHI